jgi:8-oxo-dGTP pyrophosphatase MutT (NUDIX family)
MADYDGEEQGRHELAGDDIALSQAEARKLAERYIAEQAAQREVYERAGLPIPEYLQVVPVPPVTESTKAQVGFIIALVGSGLTAAMPLITDGTTTVVLSIMAAVVTTAGVGFGVYQTPNAVKR